MNVFLGAKLGLIQPECKPIVLTWVLTTESCLPLLRCFSSTSFSHSQPVAFFLVRTKQVWSRDRNRASSSLAPRLSPASSARIWDFLCLFRSFTDTRSSSVRFETTRRTASALRVRRPTFDLLRGIIDPCKHQYRYTWSGVDLSELVKVGVLSRLRRTCVIKCNVVSKLQRNRCITFGDLRLQTNEHLHFYIYR
jgi:hypothetical protein